MDDMTLSELRIQLELNEQETAVLRRKMEDMEGENDRLSKEVLELQEKAKSGGSKTADKGKAAAAAAAAPKASTSSAGNKSNEAEISRLKNELMEKNKEIQHLNEALTQSEKNNKSKVVIQRSRSLEGESDLKVSSEHLPQRGQLLNDYLNLQRQLQLVEQEASILRTKTTDMEAENEKLAAENRRLQLRVSRKPPPTDAEKLLMDKMELEDRLKALEKKLTEAALPGVMDGSKSPRLGRDRNRLSPGAPSPAESSVLKREKEILERDLKSKEDTISSLSQRLQQLEKENENLHSRVEAKASAASLVKRTPKKPSESMTKAQLKVTCSLWSKINI